MSFYRSQTIDAFKLYLPRQSAWNIMNKLGQSQIIHIIPYVNPHETVRHFTLQIRRVEQALQKLNNLQQVLRNKKMIEIDQNINEKQKIEDIISLFNCNKPDLNGKNEPSKINQVIQKIDQLWYYYVQINKRIQMLDKQINNCRQNTAILLAGQKQYGKSFFQNQRQYSKLIQQMSFVSTNKINYKAGVLQTSEQLRFKRTVFRITKGNCLIMTKQFQQIFPQTSKNQKQKVVFFVIYPANNQSYFDRKLQKLIANFSDKIFQYNHQYSNSFNEHLQQYRKTHLQALSLKTMCQNQLDNFLFEKLLQKYKIPTKYHSNIKKYEYLKLFLIKEKYIYHNLNEMHVYNHFFQGQIYVKKQNITAVQQLLNLENKSQLPPGHISPKHNEQKFPSSFVLNDYTRPSQQIVQTYGVPRYKQINPSLFTTITFPFLFGVMFGDIGHGLIILAFGIILILIHSQTIYFKNKFTQMLLPYRYLILLMGFFSTYCGFIYNDFLSLALNIFGSCYQPENIQDGGAIPITDPQCVYPIGIDPVWSIAQNSLNYTNSLKMKISVIIGVVHMTLGVILRGCNDIFFKNYKQFVFVFIPQLLFLLSVFGYMDFLIIYKWCVDWGVSLSISAAPSIISQMIAIPLSLGSTEGKPLWNQISQQNLQYALLVIAGISIPVMLLPVPLLKIMKLQKIKIKPKKHNNKSNESSEFQNQIKEMLLNRQKSDFLNDQQLHLNDQIQPSHQQQEVSQIFVHQIIETIEFVLGSVSNTASYLRLWALSLAHSQLSQVFFEKTVQGALEVGWGGIFFNLIAFIFLAGLTIGIMLLMDTMECFLHTLRLHWVQFQNKFYKGDGFSFNTYSFRQILTQNIKVSNN